LPDAILPRVKTTDSSDPVAARPAGGSDARRDPSSGDLDVSVVIPVYNEEANLEPLHERLDAVLPGIGLSYEILFIDDGSADGGPEILRKLVSLDPHVRVLTFERNAGQSAAFEAGFRAARGEVVITLDADLQNDPADIPRVLEQLEAYDVVCGWRAKRNDNWIRRASSKIANGVRNALSNETIRDTGCSLKGYRRAHLSRLKLYDGMHRFLPTLLKMEGCTVTEIPVAHHPRVAGVSKYGIGNRVFRSFRDLLAVRWMKARQLRYRIKSDEGGPSQSD
jgi:glycosyltransferase involved in cell wall biosynthesis